MGADLKKFEMSGDAVDVLIASRLFVFSWQLYLGLKINK